MAKCSTVSAKDKLKIINYLYKDCVDDLHLIERPMKTGVMKWLRFFGKLIKVCNRNLIRKIMNK